MNEISPELKTLSQSPLVAGTPLGALDHPVIPTESFFIRNHFPVPSLEAADWKLTVSGAVQKSLSLRYQDLKQLRRKGLTALLECAGNSRAAVQPPIEGLLWDHGGVGTARWAGVSLRTVLEKAGLLSTAMEVLFEGADQGTEHGEDRQMSYAMSLPLDKALDADTLLAYEMNGETLTPAHGFPLRAIVPGWYGMTSVKWLISIRVLDQPYQGFHQSRYYVFVKEGVKDDGPQERVSSMKVKSLITWPERGQKVPTGRHVIRGIAWSGQGPVIRVEVSIDNGLTWQPAKVNESGSRFAWQQWKFDWDASQIGYFLIRVRATDSGGNCQPKQFDWNFRGFANNSIHAVPVEVLTRQ